MTDLTPIVMGQIATLIIALGALLLGYLKTGTIAISYAKTLMERVDVLTKQIFEVQDRELRCERERYALEKKVNELAEGVNAISVVPSGSFPP